MTTTERVRVPRSARHRRTLIALLAAIFIASIAGVSAHIVRGVIYPALATAFVSSPTATQDAPVKIMWVNQATQGTVDTGLRVVCFYAANTSPARADDADWPRVTALGFELPGAPSGFTLLEPLDDEWELVEGGTAAIPGREVVTLDFAMISRVKVVPQGPERPTWHSAGPVTDTRQRYEVLRERTVPGHLAQPQRSRRTAGRDDHRRGHQRRGRALPSRTAPRSFEGRRSVGESPALRPSVP